MIRTRDDYLESLRDDREVWREESFDGTAHVAAHRRRMAERDGGIVVGTIEPRVCLAGYELDPAPAGF